MHFRVIPVLEIFLKAFISEDIIKVLVDETNLYAEHFIEEKR